MSRSKRRHHATRSSPESDGSCLICSGPLDSSGLAGVKGRLADPSTLPDGPAIVDIDFGGIAIPAVVPAPNAPIARQGDHVLFLLCSASCAMLLRMLWAAGRMVQGEDVPEPGDPQSLVGLRLARPGTTAHPQLFDALGTLLRELRRTDPHALDDVDIDQWLDEPPPAGPGGEVSDEQRAWAERLLRDCCAWCGQPIGPDDAIEVLYVTLKDPSHARPGMAGIVVGDRTLPAIIPEAGAAASGLGDAAFVLCGTACMAALRAAIEHDQRLSIVH